MEGKRPAIARPDVGPWRCSEIPGDRLLVVRTLYRSCAVLTDVRQEHMARLCQAAGADRWRREHGVMNCGSGLQDCKISSEKGPMTRPLTRLYAKMLPNVIPDIHDPFSRKHESNARVLVLRLNVRGGIGWKPRCFQISSASV
jgi:hypothetical protein